MAYCYQCQKQTVLSPSDAVVRCARCGSEFVEELAQTHVRGTPGASTALPQYLASVSDSSAQNPGYPGLSNTILVPTKYPNIPEGTNPNQITFHPGSRTPPTYQPPLYVSPLFPSVGPTNQNYPVFAPPPVLSGPPLHSQYPSTPTPPNPTSSNPVVHITPITPTPPNQQPVHFIPQMSLQDPMVPKVEQKTTPQPNSASLYPVVVPARHTDGDELYAEESLPDVSRLDFSRTRFKADRDDPISTSLYLSVQSSPLPVIQGTPDAEAIETQEPNESDDPQPQSAVPPPALNALTGLFTGFVDVLRDGFDKLDELTYHIAPNVRRFRGGAPPAAEKERQQLRTVEISGEEMVTQKGCPICFCDWELGQEAKLMPCGHVFHEPCLTPWLLQRNSCPICRYELQTEDRRYERYREHRDANNL